ncbi:MAG: thiamine phosphate synthase [Planctomycetota bacterium]
MTKKEIEFPVFRLLDAAINRAGEGLRVVEDCVRLQWDNYFLSKKLKQFRHDITATVESFDTVARLSARDTQGDVGTRIQTDSEYQRGRSIPSDEEGASNWNLSLIRANFARVQQSLRTIEEMLKPFDPLKSKEVEQLRYQSYTLEKATIQTMVSSTRLEQAQLYVLVDAQHEEDQLCQRVSKLVDAGVHFIQLRDKSVCDRELVRIGQQIMKVIGGSNTRLIMNDRVDLAIAIKADGVHLGQDDLPIGMARRMLGPDRLIGISTHSITQAQEAVLAGADYIGVGPVFPSKTKQFHSFVGLELVEQVCSSIELPAFAIGGIDLENLPAVLAVGCRRVAVSGVVATATSPKAISQQILSLLKTPP